MIKTTFNITFGIALIFLMVSPLIADVPFFTVTGIVTTHDGSVDEDLQVRIGNKSKTDLNVLETQTDSKGKYRVTFIIIEDKKVVVSTGDILFLEVVNSGKLIFSGERQIKAEEINLGFIVFNVKTLAPMAVKNQEVETKEDTSKVIRLVVTGGNQSQMTYQVVTQPLQGQLSKVDGNKVTYVPNKNYHGADTFTFKGNDGIVDSKSGTVKISVSSVNDLPVAIGQQVTIQQDGSKTITLLANDIDKDTLSYQIVTPPSHGSLSTVVGSTVTYKAKQGFHGTDSFVFKANDGTIDSNQVKVAVQIEEKLLTFSSVEFSKAEAVNVGQTFSIQVIADKVSNLAGWSFNLEYDPKILSVESVEEGDALKLQGETTFFQEGKINKEEGTATGLSSVYLGTGGVEASGNLLTLNLKAIKDGEGYLRLKEVELGDPKGKAIPVNVIDTVITVSSVSPCDINADKTVNIFDLILVAQAFGKQNLSNPRSDVNKDGVVNIFDLILVAQCFGQGAAPTIVSQPVAMFAMVENWIYSAEAAADGSVEFGRGIAVLKGILSSIKPVETVLMANYPNPFNPETWIPYHLNQDAKVVIRIYDVRGRIVRRLDVGFQSFGYYASRDKAAYWDGRTETGEKVSSGVYFYRLQAGDYAETRKMVILK